jgi:hypothetical protein
VFGGGCRRAGAGKPVAEGQAGASLFQHAGVVGLDAASAQRIVEIEMQAIVVVSGDELAPSIDVGMLLYHRVRDAGTGGRGVHGHLGDLLAAGA